MVSILNSYENVEKEFSFSEDSSVPVGKYNFTQFVTHLNTSESKTLSLGIDGYAGTFYDGNRLTVGLEPLWNIGSHYSWAWHMNITMLISLNVTRLLPVTLPGSKPCLCLLQNLLLVHLSSITAQKILSQLTSD